jgi:hypothetical protein
MTPSALSVARAGKPLGILIGIGFRSALWAIMGHGSIRTFDGYTVRLTFQKKPFGQRLAHKIPATFDDAMTHDPDDSPWLHLTC